MESPEHKTMTIIGFGRMGKEYADLFAADFDLSIISSRDIEEEVAAIGARQAIDFTKAVANSEYVVPAVPLSALSEIVSRISHHIHPEATVFDTTSVKVKAMEVLGDLSCRYFSTHLLSKEKIAICGQSDALIEESLQTQGMTVVYMSPEEHDRRNAIVGMAQFIGLALGQEFTDEDRTMLGESKSGQMLLALVGHITSNVPTTYGETQIDNGFTGEQRIRLIKALQNYDQVLTEGDFPSRELS